MPPAYGGTDIISCLRSKYIIRLSPYIISQRDISFELLIENYGLIISREVVEKKQLSRLYFSPERTIIISTE